MDLRERTMNNLKQTAEYISNLEISLKEEKALRMKYGNALLVIRDQQADRDSVLCNTINNVLGK